MADNLPAPVVCLPNGTHVYADQLPATVQPQVVHVHQAPPDRTVQRVALGAGVGGGAVAGAVVLGPMLTAALVSMAASLAAVALVIAAAGWALVSVARATDAPRKD